MDLSEEQRNKIITLHTDGGLSQREVARRTGFSQSTVNRICKKYKDTGQSFAERVGRCGRKRSSSIQHDRLIVRSSLINPRLTAADIQRVTHSDLSVHTIRRRLNEGGRKCVKPSTKPLLTVEMKKRRLKWAMQHRNWTAEQWSKVSSIIYVQYVYFPVITKLSVHFILFIIMVWYC